MLTVEIPEEVAMHIVRTWLRERIAKHRKWLADADTDQMSAQHCAWIQQLEEFEGYVDITPAIDMGFEP
jgi:hypothetical protein